MQKGYAALARGPEGVRDLFQAGRSKIASRGGVALLSAQGGANLRQGMQRRDFSRCNHIWCFGEIVPHKLLHVRLDDDVRLCTPGKVRMPLDDVERAAENVCECARLLQIP